MLGFITLLASGLINLIQNNFLLIDLGSTSNGQVIFCINSKFSEIPSYEIISDQKIHESIPLAYRYSVQKKRNKVSEKLVLTKELLKFSHICGCDSQKLK